MDLILNLYNEIYSEVNKIEISKKINKLEIEEYKCHFKRNVIVYYNNFINDKSIIDFEQVWFKSEFLFNIRTNNSICL